MNWKQIQAVAARMARKGGRLTASHLRTFEFDLDFTKDDAEICNIVLTREERARRWAVH